jgi:tetratricopeptide (TPR) repeat protein
LYALGVAERRRGLFAAARRAFEGAVERAPGCVAAHLELVGTCASLSDLDASLLHAIRARSLEESPRTTGSLAEALFAKGRLAEAQEAIGRALGLDPEDAENRRLAARIREVVAQGVGAPRVRSSVPPAREGFGLFSWIAGAFKKRDGETDGDA